MVDGQYIAGVDDVSFEGVGDPLSLDESFAELAAFKLALDEHAIISVTDTDGTIIFANDKFCDISGYDREELIGQNHRILNSDHHDRHFFADLYRTIANGETWHGTLRNRAKDGSLYWVETTITPSRDDSGNITRYISIRTDVTALFTQDKVLRDQHERFDRALANMSQGLVMFDGEQRIIVCNGQFSNLYGLTYDQVQPGTTFQRLIQSQIARGLTEDRDNEIVDSVQDWLRRQSARHNMTQIRRLKDGRTLEVTFAPMADGGWLATHEDITERKRAEEELRAHRDQLQFLVDEATESLKRKAEELKRALDKEKELNTLQREFVSMASHEFRTPLAIIDGSAQRIERRAKKEEPTSEDLLPRIAKIRSAVKRMTRLVDSTLSAARMEEGAIGVEIEPFNFARLVEDVAAREQEMAPSHRFRTHLHDLPDVIEADRGAIDQILTNLLSNAVKYAPDAPDIDIVAMGRGAYVVLAVCDHGIGIDAEDLARIGERFFRAKTSTGIEGTGIGLNLVGNLIDLHEGRLHVHSSIGEGSIFAVCLPIEGPSMIMADMQAAGEAFFEHGTIDNRSDLAEADGAGDPFPIFKADQ